MYRRFGKRFLDIILSALGLIALTIILIPVSVSIYIEDRGPIFYIASRLGKDGNVFKMYKFRSMKVNAPDLRKADGSTYNGEDDPRLTRVGKFIRKSSIDELPQLLNVLKGDMSLIGPRPDLIEALEKYKNNEKRKLEVRPGITGYSQAYFRNSIEQSEKFKNDVYYVDNISLIFDIRIAIKTIIQVIKKEGIYIESNSSEMESMK